MWGEYFLGLSQLKTVFSSLNQARQEKVKESDKYVANSKKKHVQSLKSCALYRVFEKNLQAYFS